MSLRRVVLALAVLCLTVGVASAQFSLAQQVTCTVSSSSNPSLRSESTHELVGDVILQCVSVITNASLPPGQVPAVDITVNYGTAITSRQAASGNPAVTYSDAALVIDDPNTYAAPTNNIPLATGYGPGAALLPCQTITITAAGATSEAPACPTYDISTTGVGNGIITPTNGGYYVISATQAETSAPAKNVYQGVITGGGQSVTFYGVPVAAPVSAGIYRKYRVVNVRVAPGSATISATVSVGGPNGGSAGVMLLPNPTTTVGAGKLGFAYATSSATGVASVPTIVSQCLAPQSLSSGTASYSPNVALLSFSQNFANAAKPQTPTGPTGAVAPTTAGAGATQYGNLNYEEEVVMPSLLAVTTAAAGGANGQFAATPGAADSGTRFKAVFAGLPYNSNTKSSTIYVSLYNVTSFTADASTQGTASPSAILTQGNTVKAVGAAGAEFDAYLAAAPSNPLFQPAANLPAVGTTISVVPVTIASNGTATVVWEVNALSAGKSSTFNFAVYINYSSTSNVPALSNATVTLSAAPVQPATAPTTPNLVQIPSYTTTPLGPNGVVNVVPCQTALLFPFVTTAKVSTTQHWETGIAIANTGNDPWGSVAVPTTVPTTNTCTINFYGIGVATGASTFTPPAVTGPAIGPGQNWAFVASDPLATGTAPNVGFSGYAFAVCNFSFAHGFAFIEDNSPAGNAMGYLAMVVNNQVQLSRPTALNGEGLEN